MPKFRPPTFRAIVILSALGVTAAIAATAAQLSLPLQLTAFAVNLSAEQPAAQAETVQINIERWSTEAEKEDLLGTLRKGGPDVLLASLQKMSRVGYIRTPDSVGWDLHYAQTMPTDDGGQRLVIATDRRISFWEIYNNTRSTNYPFTIIEIHLDKNGNGEGRMSLATRVVPGADGKSLELENYSAQPVLLKSVKIQTK